MKVELRKDQEKIIKYNGGKLGVPAVPGAGKTFILCELTKKLIGNLEEGEEILILTYMNSAVKTFKDRIEGGTSNRRTLREDVRVSTIHSLASDIIKENIKLLNLGDDYIQIPGSEVYHTMLLGVKEYIRNYPREFGYFLKERKDEKKWIDTLTMLGIYINSKVKNEGISVKRLISDVRNYKRESLLGAVGKVLGYYFEICQRKGYIDYDDLLLEAYKVLKSNPSICEKYKKKYKYILEDEAQDSNKLQNKIIKLISNGNLVRVGDLNQCILSTFTTSDPILFKRFLDANLKAELYTAGRSSSQIIELVNYFVENTWKNHPVKEARNALEKQLIREVEKGEKPENPKVLKFGLKAVREKTGYDEEKKIVEVIKVFLEKNKEDNIGILCPFNYQVDNIGKLLKGEGISYSVISGVTGELLKALDILGDLLLFLSKPSKNFYLLRYLDDVLKEELKEEYRGYIKTESSRDILKLKEDRPWKGTDEEKKVDGELHKLTILLEYPQNSVERLLLLIGDILEWEGEPLLLIEKIVENLKKIYKLNPKWTLFEVASEMKKSKNSQFTYLAKLVVEERSDLEVEVEERVNIGTYHSSKGMEWDFVWLMGVGNKRFPAYISEDSGRKKEFLKFPYDNPFIYIEKEFQELYIDKSYKNLNLEKKVEEIKEGIRLLYVGMTRAKKYLVVSSNQRDSGYYFKVINEYIQGKRREYE